MSNDSSFNLIDRQWIPVTMRDDGRECEMSIAQVLEDADPILQIEGDMPLQRFTITRFLLAIMYGTFNHDFVTKSGAHVPFGERLWRKLFQEGSHGEFARKRISSYLQRYHDRFDLFDSRQPFYQVADLHTSNNTVSGLEKLILDMPNGEPFFTTRIGEGLSTLDAAEAARWLITAQAFDPSGIKSGAVGDDRVTNSKGYPIGTAWCGNLGGFLVEGESLWQTLMLNFVSEEVLGNTYPGITWANDKPEWERPALTSAIEVGYDQSKESVGATRYFHGPATLLTWQSRRIRLRHQGEVVDSVVLANGDRIKPQNAYCYEMMSGWRRSEAQKKKLGDIVYMPRLHDPARALWRGLPLLTAADSDGGSVNGPADYLRPFVLDWLTKLKISDVPVRLHAYGVSYGPQEAVVDSTIDDALDLNLVVLTTTNPHMGQMIESAVDMADQGVNAFRYFAATVAQAQGLDVSAPRKNAGDIAYSAFDRAFRDWVRQIDTETDLTSARDAWSEQAKSLLLRLERKYMDRVSPRGMVGRTMPHKDSRTGVVSTRHVSAAAADMWFRKQLNRIFVGDGGYVESTTEGR